MEIKRLFDFIEHVEKDLPERPDVLARSIGGQWHYTSTREFVDKSHSVARGLLALGFGKGTKVIDISASRPEWNFIDMGSALAGMIHIPVYSTLSHDDYLYIFNHSDAEVIFLDNEKLYAKLAPVVEEMDRSAKVILIDDSDTIFCLSQMCAQGDAEREKWDPVLEKNKQEISEDECVSIVYTSGTTGRPKGVMLSHRNLVFDAHAHAIRHIMDWHHIALSFLPLCHAYERTMIYDNLERGIRIYYAENLSTIAADMASCHADNFCGVPRVLEMMYAKFEAAGKQLKGIKHNIYRHAWYFANHFDSYDKHPFYVFRHKLYDKLVYSRWREALGGHRMIVVSGGSSIQEKIVRCFTAAGFQLCEGYGMTETSPVISVNNPVDKLVIIGTVGQPIDGTEIKFSDEGEIMVRGPHVMMGYYKDPEQTREIIDEDGWLHTGDIGYLVDGRFLKITDRKKEMFKLNNGKYIAPQAIETKLKESPLIEQCCVFGENHKYASAIIVPNFNALRAYCKDHKIKVGGNADMLSNAKVISKLHREVGKVNDTLAAHEQIRKEQFVDDTWGIDNGMLSQTLKLKRSNIYKKYADLMEKAYE
ncbi:MAG: long-chain fatty acid--CoA ligase [Bacteroidales bacterium]|nr:long-chain fatty acid--CoA ligase [Bacteroidales bacterium]